MRILPFLTFLPRERQERAWVALARPMLTSDAPSKVALISVLGCDRDLLAPQISRIKPDIIKHNLPQTCIKKENAMETYISPTTFFSRIYKSKR